MGGYDLSADHNSVTLGDGVELVVEPAFGDLIKTTYAGLKIADLGAAGLYNTAVTEPQLFANIGAVLPITVAPGVPSGAEGELAYFLNALEAQFDPITASVGQMAKFKFAARAAGGPLVRGLILRNTPAPGDAATGNGTVFQLGAIGAAQFLWAAVHVFALTGGTSPTLTLALQSAPTVGFAAPTTRFTFTAFTTAPNTAWLTPQVGGPITDQFWRVTYTITGAPTGWQYAIAAGIV